MITLEKVLIILAIIGGIMVMLRILFPPRGPMGD